MKQLIQSILLLSIFLISCTSDVQKKDIDILSTDSGETISLNGEWQLALVPDQFQDGLQDDAGIEFTDVVQLPGTLSENKKGTKNTNKEVWNNLSLEYEFEGTAYYQRSIAIPSQWKNKRIALRLERTRKTAVWLDGKLIGTNPHLSTAQVYELEKLTPGKHELVIAVDNVVSKHPGGRSHMNEAATQTNWNGIVGKIQLEATPQVWISRVRIHPEPEDKKAIVELTLNQRLREVQKGKIHISSQSFNSESLHKPKDVSFDFKISGEHRVIKAQIDFGENMLLWDEFNPALYRSTITLELENGQTQVLGRTYGMRSFTQNGSQFVINGHTTFLRGKHDACVFPLTGYAPMDVEEWIRILNIAKEYGINHYRFHTWCPPEAALAAADMVGIYMQPELPCWGELDAQERGVSFKDINAVAFGSEKTAKGKKYDPSVPTMAETFFHKEAEHILDQYGNYASFVMFGIGNELKGNKEVMKRLVTGFRTYDDNRRLYSQGSNNNFRKPEVFAEDDYFTTVRTSEKTWNEYDNNTRISFSAADQFDFGMVNHLKPSTRVNFTKALEDTKVPVIGHETGQYCYYPDYNEMEKYTGVTKPWNYTLAQNLLKQKGMYQQWPEFFKAAGKWASILYCEDMEAGIRTPGFGGFQLLDLQDFPGQGTALVGPLNVFMESKGTITPQKWQEYCAPVTLLAEFDEYTLSGGSDFVADISVANYSDQAINTILNWSVEGIDNGMNEVKAVQGQLTKIGEISLKLPEVEKAKRVNLKLTLGKTGVVKSYPLWIYPAPKNVKAPENVNIARKLDDETLDYLQKGGRVLLIPDHADIKNNSVGGLFMTEFWSYRMFKTIAERKGVEPSPGTLGLLINENHPIFEGFPSEYHSNWQWWSAVKNSRPIILDDAPKGYKPIVQTIDNMWRSHKLGTLFEFKVGKGKVLVSAIDLAKIEETTDGNALYNSILDYMSSDKFDPEVEISRAELFNLIY